MPGFDNSLGLSVQSHDPQANPPSPAKCGLEVKIRPFVKGPLNADHDPKVVPSDHNILDGHLSFCNRDRLDYLDRSRQAPESIVGDRLTGPCPDFRSRNWPPRSHGSAESETDRSPGLQLDGGLKYQVMGSASSALCPLFFRSWPKLSPICVAPCRSTASSWMIAGSARCPSLVRPFSTQAMDLNANSVVVNGLRRHSWTMRFRRDLKRSAIFRP